MTTFCGAVALIFHLKFIINQLGLLAVCIFKIKKKLHFNFNILLYEYVHSTFQLYYFSFAF